MTVVVSPASPLSTALAAVDLITAGAVVQTVMRAAGTGMFVLMHLSSLLFSELFDYIFYVAVSESGLLDTEDIPYRVLVDYILFTILHTEQRPFLVSSL